ncbi:YebC/PmpR family DNA-binding transcriptional regulator [Candidatus Gracilibacteria bacterium]|nr:YebC/PmpR family DNA-binding transcriptional regulator [Candidatus Gracilibacteria bacterium]
MGRGPVIEQRRNITNAQKGKTFTIHAKLITLAAQKGGDPDKNPALSDAIYKAKKDNVPNENIARAIKKGTGEDKTGTQIQEVFYEGYGAGGVGVIVKVLTDNKNRTASNIRHLFTKNGGSLGEAGSLSGFTFKFVGVCYIDITGKKLEEIEEFIIESGASDYSQNDENTIKIITEKQSLKQVTGYLESKGLKIMEYNLEYMPVNTIEISDFEKAVKILKLVEELENDEDVETVWFNYEMSEELEKQAKEAIENAKFRT